jgi:hypothetical protein
LPPASIAVAIDMAIAFRLGAVAIDLVVDKMICTG